MKKVFGLFSAIADRFTGCKSEGDTSSDYVMYSGLYANIVKNSFTDTTEQGTILRKAFEMGCKCYNEGDNENALKIFIKMIDKISDKDEMAIVYFFLGVCYYETKKFEESVNSYKKAINLRIGFTDALNNLGVLLSEINKDDEAVSYLLEAVKGDDVSEYEYSNLANTYLLADKYEEAVVYALKAIGINQNLVLPYEILAVAYHHLGQIDKAKEYYMYCKENGCDNENILEEIFSQEVA